MQEGDKTLKSVALVILIYPVFAYTQNFRFLHGTDGGKFALREGERERGREGERERGRERITIQNWLRSLLHSNSKRRVRIGRGKLR